MAQKLRVQYIHYYTDGSAARKIAPAVPERKNVELPKQRKLKRRTIYLDPVPTLGTVVAICMLAMMVVGLFQLKVANEQMKAMEGYVEQLSEKNTMLATKYQEGYDLEKIRQTALALDMIPAEQAKQVTIEIPGDLPQQEPITLWDRIGTFLTGLFA